MCKEMGILVCIVILRKPVTELHICVSTYHELCGDAYACRHVVTLAQNWWIELLFSSAATSQ